MANQFIVNGTVTLNSDSFKLATNLNNTLTLNGTGNSTTTTYVTASAWTALVTSSLSNYRAGAFVNQGDANGSGSITLATGSAGGNQLMILSVGDGAVHYWNGNNILPLFAQVVSGTSTGSVVLQYSLTTS